MLYLNNLYSVWFLFGLHSSFLYKISLIIPSTFGKQQDKWENLHISCFGTTCTQCLKANPQFCERAFNGTVLKACLRRKPMPLMRKVHHELVGTASMVYVCDLHSSKDLRKIKCNFLKLQSRKRDYIERSDSIAQRDEGRDSEKQLFEKETVLATSSF